MTVDVRLRKKYEAEQYWPGKSSDYVKNDTNGIIGRLNACDSTLPDDPESPHVHISPFEVILVRPSDWIITCDKKIVEVLYDLEFYEKFEVV